MKCPECGAATVRHGHEEVCPICGLVVDDAALAPPVPPPADGSTPRVSKGSGRLARTHRQAMAPDATERRWAEARDEARRLAERLGCPMDVADEAARLLRRARRAGLTKGRPMDALAAASLMASCRRLQLARTEEELATHAKVSAAEIQAAYRSLVKGLKLPVPSMTAQEFIGQLRSRLGLSAAVEGRARELLIPVCGHQVAAGKSPLGWAVAALVMAAHEAGSDITVKAAAQAAQVGYQTVRARLGDLEALAPGP